MHQEHRRTVEERWGDQTFNADLRRLYWMASPVIRRALNRRVTGDPDVDWLTYFDSLVLRAASGPFDVAVLGCGEGWVERLLAASPAVRRIDAFDISPEAVRTAARLAREQGLQSIRYRVMDLDVEELTPGRYDAVVAHSVIHHLRELERAFATIHHALRPGGILLLNEYVGPNRLQYTDAQMERINRVMVRLPERLRRSATQGVVYPHRERPNLAHLDEIDPSEAVRSRDLLTVLEDRFEILRRDDCGGTLLQPMLYDLVHNFRPDHPDDDAVLELICLLEERLIEGGTLDSDFAVVLARRRDSAPDRFRAAPKLAERPERQRRFWDALRRRLPGIGSDCRNLRSRVPQFSDLEILRRHLHERATGDPACDPLTWILSRVRGRRSAATLSGGWLVEPLQGLFDRVAVGPLRPHGGHDLVLSYGATDVRDLLEDGWWESVVAALAPGGTFGAVLSMGPRSRRPGARERDLIHRIVTVLPSRMAVTSPVEPWRRCAGSEPVTVDAIRSKVGAYLEIDALRPLGWSLLEALVPRLHRAVDEEREEDATLLRLLALIDGQLTDDGLLPTAYVLVTGHRRD